MKASDPRHPLYQSLLKFNRAHDQYIGLGQEIETFLSTNPYTVQTIEDPDRKQILGVLRIRENPPPHWSLAIGEITHNLRCALDYAVFQLVIHHTGAAPSDDSRTQFPIYKTSDGFRFRGVPLDLRGVDPATHPLIESMQPYAKGEDTKSPLWHLRILSNWDKHRAITLTGVTQTTAKISGRSARLGIAHGIAFEDGATLFWLEPTSSDVSFVEWAAKAQMEYDQVSFAIAFALPAHEHGLPVKLVLESIGGRVFEAISEINSRVFAPVWGSR